MTYVKVCGLSKAEEAAAAVQAGADAVGVVMSPKSVRNVDIDTATRVFEAVPPDIDTVLVVSHMPVAEAIATAHTIGARVIQLHGRYAPDDISHATAGFPRVWLATSLADAGSLVVGEQGEEALLLDAPKAGSGETWDLAPLTASSPAGRWLLAGGLSPANVADAIAEVRPSGVDVSSGVESAPGVKSPALISAFVKAAKATAV